MIYLDGCEHSFCKGCLVFQIKQEYVQCDGNIVYCRQCNAILKDYEIKELITKQEKEIIEQELIEKQFNIVTCVKCQQKFSFEKGNNKGV